MFQLPLSLGPLYRLNSCHLLSQVGSPADLSRFKRSFRMKNIVEHMEQMRTHACEIHQGEEYKYYCKTCETPTCKDCTLQQHRKHDYSPVGEVADVFTQRLVQKLGELRDRHGKLAHDIPRFEKLVRSFDTRKEKVHAEINQHFDKLVETLETQRHKLIAKASELTRLKSEHTEMKIDDLRLTQTCLASNIHDIETRFDNLKSEEIIFVEKRISEDLKNMQFDNEYTDFSEHSDLEFFIPIPIEDFEKSISKSYLVGNGKVKAEYCTTSVKPTTLRKDEQACVTVTCRFWKNMPVNSGGQAVRAEYSGNASVREAGNIDRQDGSHDIIFVPTSTGKLVIRFFINGKEATNCRLHKTVR